VDAVLTEFRQHQRTRCFSLLYCPNETSTRHEEKQQSRSRRRAVPYFSPKRG